MKYPDMATSMQKNCSLLIFIGLFCFYSGIRAQTLERPEKESMMIGEPVSVLMDATGWILQDNGEWEGRKNMIPHRDNELNKSKKGPAKTGLENFSKLEMRQVILDNEDIYTVLLFYYTEGYYEYPKIEQNWVRYPSVKFYVFKEEILSRVLPDNILFNQPKVVNLNLICNGKLINYDEKTYLFKIQNTIREAVYMNQESVYTALFAVLPVEIKNEKTIRFRFIEVLNKIDVYAKYLRSVNWPKLFESAYFESDFQDFFDFIELASPVNPSKMADSAFIMKYYVSGMKKSKEKNFPGAIVDFSKALRSSSKTINRQEIMLQRGIARYHAKDFQGSVKDLSSILNDSLMLGSKSEIINKALHYRGLSYFENQEIYAACDDWTTAANNGYKDVDSYVEKICLQKDYETKLLSRVFRFHYKKGLKKAEDSSFVKAIARFNKAESIQPENNFFPLYYHRGISYYQLNEMIAAEQDLSRAVRIKPGKYSRYYMLWADALYYLGDVQLQNKDTVQGCENIRMAILSGSKLPDDKITRLCTPEMVEVVYKTDSTGYHHHIMMGIQSYKQGDFFRSMEWLHGALQLFPDNPDPEIFYYLGLSGHQTEDYLSAIEYFNKALQAAGKTMEKEDIITGILFNRGVSKFYLQDIKGACNDWQMSMNTGLQDKQALTVIKANCK